MHSKIEVGQFIIDAIKNQAAFDAVQQYFESTYPPKIKIKRHATLAHSYIWYEDPNSNQKIVLRLANADVEGHILGAGNFGRAKYGVDKYGTLYAVKIEETIAPQYYCINYNAEPARKVKKFARSLKPGTFAIINNELYYKTTTTNELQFLADPQNVFAEEKGTITDSDKKLMIAQYQALKQILLKQDPNKLERANFKKIKHILPYLEALNEPIKIKPLKTKVTNEEDIAQDVNLAFGPTKERILTYPKSKIAQGLLGKKYYTVMKFGGPSLASFLTKNQLTLNDKISVARRVLWAVYQLHTGMLSTSGLAYIHGDLKPANILLTQNHLDALLIDYGFSIPATDTDIPDGGSPVYMPLLIDESIDDYVLRIKNLKLGIGIDIFALKRTLCMPNIAEGALIEDSIFTLKEWAQLPKLMTENILIEDNNQAITQAIDHIIRFDETAISLAMRFIAMEAVPINSINPIRDYKTNYNRVVSIPLEKQVMLCECFALLDEIQKHNPEQKEFNKQDIIINKMKSNRLLQLKKELLVTYNNKEHKAENNSPTTTTLTTTSSDASISSSIDTVNSELNNQEHAEVSITTNEEFYPSQIIKKQLQHNIQNATQDDSIQNNKNNF